MTPEQSVGGTLPDLQATAAPVRLRMRVDGMTCASCERHVEQALLAAGATEADADFRRNEVVLSVPEAPDQAALRNAVQGAGYQPGGIDVLTATQTNTELREYRLSVEGMTCTDCERHVAQALREAGATDPVANFRRGEVHFSAPATAESQTFTAAVAQTGYRPGNVESVAPEP